MNLLKSMNRRMFVDEDVANSIKPNGEAGDAEVWFFSPGSVNNDALKKKYDSRHRRPADPYEIISVNIFDPTFSDDYPNATVWKNKRGVWCYIAFELSCDERIVRVGSDNSGEGWAGGWWFGGVPVM